jgi:hypothetical protein
MCSSTRAARLTGPQSTYYFEGNTGHPVFQTRFGAQRELFASILNTSSKCWLKMAC